MKGLLNQNPYTQRTPDTRGISCVQPQAGEYEGVDPDVCASIGVGRLCNQFQKECDTADPLGVKPAEDKKKEGETKAQPNTTGGPNTTAEPNQTG